METPEELGAMTVRDLRRLARERNLTGASRMRKDDLVVALGGVPQPAEEPAAGLPAHPVRELRRLALDQGIKGAGRMNKAELLERLAGLSEGLSSPVAETPQPSPPPHESTFAFPASYGVDRAVLMVRDPGWLFSYFDISGDTWAEIIRRGITRPGSGWVRVLRLRDVTGVADGEAGAFVVDLELDENAREWYFQAPRADCDYAVEFGYRSPTGEFVLVARSNAVCVPRCEPSIEVDETWGSLHQEAYRLSLGGLNPASAGVGSASQMNRRLGQLLEEGISSAHFHSSQAGD